MGERLAQLEARLAFVEAHSAPIMDARAAMRRLGYRDGKSFWHAVRRTGIPYSRLSARRCVFRASDIDAALLRRQVGNSRQQKSTA